MAPPSRGLCRCSDRCCGSLPPRRAELILVILTVIIISIILLTAIKIMVRMRIAIIATIIKKNQKKKKKNNLLSQSPRGCSSKMKVNGDKRCFLKLEVQRLPGLEVWNNLGSRLQQQLTEGFSNPRRRDSATLWACNFPSDRLRAHVLQSFPAFLFWLFRLSRISVKTLL